MNMPGYGDAATWGTVKDPRDPRYDESAEEAKQGDIEHAVETVEYYLGNIRMYLTMNALEKAEAEFNKIAGVSL